MVSRNLITRAAGRLAVSSLLLILYCTVAIPVQAYAKGDSEHLPSLNTFIESVKDGKAGVIRGVYIPNVMAYAVTQQPAGKPGFVSTEAAVTTQFSMAAEAGNIGLLAHNTLAGRSFSSIIHGDKIILIYGDGRAEDFMVETILLYQALDPLSPYGQFKDLGTQKTLSTEELFNKVYRGEYHVTLQTCIENDGNISWGRLFVIAEPIVEEEIPLEDRIFAR